MSATLRHAIRFEAVSAGTDGIACVVAGAISDYTGIARVVFFNFENNLHQVGADVGNFRKDPASNTQRGRAERFAR